jgi:hypothetical protein
MKPILTQQTFPLGMGMEGRLFEFDHYMSRPELDRKIETANIQRPWTHATSDDLMIFSGQAAKHMRELGLEDRKSLDDKNYEDVVICLGSVSPTGRACHKMFKRGWSLAFNRSEQWGGSGMFILAKRPVKP